MCSTAQVNFLLGEKARQFQVRESEVREFKQHRMGYKSFAIRIHFTELNLGQVSYCHRTLRGGCHARQEVTFATLGHVLGLSNVKFKAFLAESN